jgi:hypothetical protein
MTDEEIRKSRCRITACTDPPEFEVIMVRVSDPPDEKVLYYFCKKHVMEWEMSELVALGKWFQDLGRVLYVRKSDDHRTD